MIARRVGVVVLVVGCALVGVLEFAGESAFAAYVHKYEAQIAGGGSMTVDGGSLLVNEGSRLSEFNASSDALVAQLSASSVGLGGFGPGVAVGHATGETELYTGTSREGVGVLGVGVCGTVECASVQEQWTGADTPNGSFLYNENKEHVGLLEGLAVDNSSSVTDWAKGDVFVATTSNYTGANQNVDVVDVFRPEAGGKEKYVAQLTSASLGGEAFEPFTGARSGAVAVSEVNGDVLVVNRRSVVDVFEPTGVGYVFVRALTGPGPGRSFGSINGVAVVGGSGLGAGDILVSTQVEGVAGVYEFGPSGEFLDRITGTATKSFGGPGAVVVDPGSDRVFVSDSAIDVFSGLVVVPDTAMEGVTGAKYESGPNTWSLDLTGSVNPDGAGPATCRFVWGSTPALGNQAVCEGTGESAAKPVPDGTSFVGVHARISGLAPDSTYYYRLQASNENGANEGEEAQDQSFTTPGPGIHEESASSVTATSATLNAAIDPDNNPTSYYFQYGTSASYGQGVLLPPGLMLGSGKGDLNASVPVQGLTAGTVYHYRVVAVSEVAGEAVTVEGPDETFTTQVVGGGLGLPDGREWEMVSPPDKHGALIYAITPLQLVQASVNGNAIAYGTDAPTESGSQGYTNNMQVFSGRGPGGWVSRDVSPPVPVATGATVGIGYEFRFFSEDLSLSVVQPFGAFDPGISVEASEQTAMLRTNYLHGNPSDICMEACYRPLVTGKPGFANVPEGTVFGEPNGNKCPPGVICGPEFVGATPDLSHVFLKSPVALTPEKSEELYEWSGGKLKASSEAEVSSPRDLESEDGSWVYSFSGKALAPGAAPGDCSSSTCNLYVTHGGATKLVAVLSPADHPDWNPDGNSEKRGFTRVSPNGRWIAFMSDRELTGYDNRDAVSGKPDEEVYLYDAEANGGEGRLVCASCNPTGARPVGVEMTQGMLVNGVYGWGISVAANIPQWVQVTVSKALYQPRYLSNTGRLFFNSNDALVPQDVNGTEDVYEYEPSGVGDCTTSSVVFGVRSDGCVSLISSGSSPTESAFLDASGSGGDVFFLTTAKLSPADYDTVLDVYDAHECTSAMPCYPVPAATPPACDTEASCRAAPSRQPAVFGSPSSATFSGAGNVTQPVSGSVVKKRSLSRTQKLARALRGCLRKRRGRRAACKRQALVRYARTRSSGTAMKIGRG